MGNKKRAIVLSGGGTKGAYEIGVWRALKELDIRYEIVTGTSTGSINAALMVMGDYEKAESLWKNIVMGNLMTETRTAGRSIKGFFQTVLSPKEFMKSKMIEGSVDNAPFLDFVEKNIEEDVIRSSAIDYGLVMVRAKDRKGYAVSKKEIPDGKMKDYIIASSSVYPIFPMHQIGEEYFIDGMYHDNLPIDLAISMGAEELIVVDLHQKPQHPNYAGCSNVLYLTPSADLGGILAFDRKKINENLELGYRDAMQKFSIGKG